MEISRIELPTDFRVGPVNAYLILGDEPTLIDCGVNSDASWAVLLAGLKENGLAVTDLQKVIITHAHVDHFGGARRLSDAGSADIWIADLGYSWIVEPALMWQKRLAYYESDFLPQTALPSAMQQMVLNYMRFSASTAEAVPTERVHAFAPDGSLAFGGANWQVIHTPGHARHQTCFYHAETGQFISADMLLHKAPTPVLERPLPGQPRTPGLSQFLTSLNKIEPLAVKTVYPGHGEIFHNYKETIQQQRTRILQRKEECYRLIATGVDNVAALVDKMYAHYPAGVRLVGLWMLVGYLDLLKEAGKVVETEVDGVWRYKVLT